MFPDVIDFGPLFCIDTDVTGSRRCRALGPVFESYSSLDGKTLRAVRPFYCSVEDPSDQWRERNIVWPLWIGKCRNSESQWRFAAIMLWRNYDRDDPRSKYKFQIFPVYFQGRARDGNPYYAVFPLGGVIRDFLFRDKIVFALFPLYCRDEANQVYTWSFLWPVFSRTTDHGIERFRVFPFYGQSSLRTDFTKRFVLWPFWTSVHYGYPGSTGYGYILFPLFGRVKRENQESWLFIPPLFRFSKGDKKDLVYCPWPIFQKSKGEVDKLYIWPLWGYQSSDGYRSSFILWPLARSYKSVYPEFESRGVNVFPFVRNQSLRTLPKNGTEETEVFYRKFKLWPLFCSERHGNKSFLRAPILWPFKDYRQIERNYSPFWTLYTHASYDSVSEDEVLWGMFRYRRSSEGMLNISLFPLFSAGRNRENRIYHWSFLKGLLGYKRSGDKKELRILFLFRWKLSN